MTGDRIDACRDTAALIRATADDDREGTDVILDHGDTRAIAQVLAVIVASAIGCGASPSFLGDLCEYLRTRFGQEDT